MNGCVSACCWLSVNSPFWLLPVASLESIYHWMFWKHQSWFIDTSPSAVMRRGFPSSEFLRYSLHCSNKFILLLHSLFLCFLPRFVHATAFPHLNRRPVIEREQRDQRWCESHLSGIWLGWCLVIFLLSLRNLNLTETYHRHASFRHLKDSLWSSGLSLPCLYITR